MSKDDKVKVDKNGNSYRTGIRCPLCNKLTFYRVRYKDEAKNTETPFFCTEFRCNASLSKLTKKSKKAKEIIADITNFLTERELL